MMLYSLRQNKEKDAEIYNIKIQIRNKDAEIETLKSDMAKLLMLPKLVYIYNYNFIIVCHTVCYVV